MAVRITHSVVEGGTVDETAAIDGVAWDAEHTVTGLENVPNVDTTNASNLSSGTVPAARIAATGKPYVILSTGQSNLVHEVTFANTPNANVTRWNNALGTEGSIGTAYAALPTTTINVIGKLASDIADNNLTRPVKVINISFASQAIAQWLSGASAVGSLVDCYAEIQANITAALAAAGVSKIDAFVWWQGESDTANASYAANFATMMTRFWTNSWFPQETPALIFGIAPTSISGDAGSNKVNNYLQASAATDPDKRRFVYTGSLPTASWLDTLHMTGQGYFSAGAMAASAFLNGPGRASLQGVAVDPVTGFVNIGTPGTPDARVTISGNTALPSTAIDVNSAIHAVGKDGDNHSAYFDAFGGSNILVSRRWDGTLASPAAVGAASQIWSSQARAWDGAAMSIAIATFDALTVNAQTGSDHSTRYRMRLVPTGSTTLAEYFSFQPGSFTINGKTSGGVNIAVPNVAGSNTLTLPAGTTDFSATGGTSKFVKQSSAGGALTVEVVAVSDLTATATNDSAAAGKVGEYVESLVTSGSPVTGFVTSTAKTITSISLTAGDWDVSGMANFLPAAATSITGTRGSISLVTNTLDSTPGRDSNTLYAAFVPGGSFFCQVLPPTRISISTTSAVYLIGQAGFTVSTMSAFGAIRARRVR